MTQISTFSGGSSGRQTVPSPSSSLITLLTREIPSPAFTMLHATKLSGVVKLMLGFIPRLEKQWELSVSRPLWISIYGSLAKISAETLFPPASGWFEGRRATRSSSLTLTLRKGPSLRLMTAKSRSRSAIFSASSQLVPEHISALIPGYRS